MVNSQTLNLAVAAAVLVCAAHVAEPRSEWIFECIWDQSDGVPGAVGFSVGIDPPAFDGEHFVFRARNSSQDYEGIYMIDGDGEIHLVADVNTLDPMYGLHLRDFLELSLSNGRIAFIAHTTLVPSAIFLWEHGELSMPINSATPAPGGPGNFTNFNHVRINGDSIAHSSRSVTSGHPPVRGMYFHDLATGQDSLITNDEQPVPGFPGEEFFTFEYLDVEGSSVVFRAQVSAAVPDVIVTNLGGTLRTIVSTSSGATSGKSTFTRLNRPRIGDDCIAFHGRGPTGRQGIYLWRDDVTTTVVDSETPLPDGSTTFDNIERDFSMHLGNVVFRADTDLDVPGDPDPTGLFALFEGKLMTILRRGSELDGRVVQRIYLHQEGLHADTVAFTVRFEDFSSSLYTATLTTQGDANGDHLVNMADINIVLGNFLRSGEPGIAGDVNDDGEVDMADLNMVLEHFHAD